MMFFPLVRSFWEHKYVKVGAGLLIMAVVFFAGFRLAQDSPISAPFTDGKGGGVSYADSSGRSMAFSQAEFAMSAFPLGEGDLSQYKTVGPKIIKTGYLSLDVKNIVESMKSAMSVATKYEGFVESSSTWLDEYENSLYGDFTLRVASIHFDSAMNELRGLATIVRNETISGQDVTEQYIDLDARLLNLKAEEAQYLMILKKAVKVEDLLDVHNSLAEVRSEIESLEGQIQSLTNRTDYSTITVRMQEEASIKAPTRTWKPFVVVKEALQSLVVAGQGVVDAFIYIIIFGLPLVIVFGLVYLGWRRIRR